VIHKLKGLLILMWLNFPTLEADKSRIL
jgi:hypothetical protein